MLCPGLRITHAHEGAKLPSSVAKQLGSLYLRRYLPNNPSIVAIRQWKRGEVQGVLTWAETDAGKVVGWALRAHIKGKLEVMVFVIAAWRRRGIASALLDHCRAQYPAGNEWVYVYRHDEVACAFYKARDRRYGLTHRVKER